MIVGGDEDLVMVGVLVNLDLSWIAGIFGQFIYKEGSGTLDGLLFFSFWGSKRLTLTAEFCYAVSLYGNVVRQIN